MYIYIYIYTHQSIHICPPTRQVIESTRRFCPRVMPLLRGAQTSGCARQDAKRVLSGPSVRMHATWLLLPSVSPRSRSLSSCLVNLELFGTLGLAQNVGFQTSRARCFFAVRCLWTRSAFQLAHWLGGWVQPEPSSSKGVDLPSLLLSVSLFSSPFSSPPPSPSLSSSLLLSLLLPEHGRVAEPCLKPLGKKRLLVQNLVADRVDFTCCTPCRPNTKLTRSMLRFLGHYPSSALYFHPWLIVHLHVYLLCWYPSNLISPLSYWGIFVSFANKT